MKKSCNINTSKVHSKKQHILIQVLQVVILFTNFIL